MKQELLNKIELTKTQLLKEEVSYKELSPVLEEVIGLKKKITIDALKKYQYKLELELSKITNAEEKEKREAPIRELMAKINENNKAQKELKTQLDNAKALAKNPKNQDAQFESFKLANELGDMSRANVKLVEEKTELLGRQAK